MINGWNRVAGDLGQGMQAKRCFTGFVVEVMEN
jgi:hypothetical protein